MAFYILILILSRSNVPEDPIFRLTFPQPDMLKPEQLESMLSAILTTEMCDHVKERCKRNFIVDRAKLIRNGLNPHPAGQKEENIPKLEGRDVLGCQHKYQETVLFFPAEVGLSPVRLSLARLSVSMNANRYCLGSILSCFLYILLSLGTVYRCRIQATV